MMRRLAILAALTALMATFAIAADVAPAEPNSPESKNPVVLTVNGDEVSAAEISMILQQIESQLAGREDRPSADELVEAATQRVIEQKLLAQEARRFGMTADEKQVDEMLEMIEAQAGGRETLDENLAAGGSSYDQLRGMLLDMDLARQLIRERIEPTVSLSDEEVREFYDANTIRFQHPEQVRARHIIFKVDEDETDGQAKAAAEAARKRALAGEDFAELAGELSEGPSAPRGGDLGWFSRQQMVNAFAEAAFALEPGDISDVVQSEFGYHVIKVEDHRDSGLMPFEDAKPQIEAALLPRKVAQQVAGLLEKLTESAEIDRLE